MIFILPGILLVSILALAVWAWFFRAVLVQERAVRDARQREADFERWLSTPGEPLYCVACQELFCGPLPATGCPRCQTRAFVIPVRASDDPAITARALSLPHPPVGQGGTAVAEDAPATVSETPSQQQPWEPLQQGKNKR
jgi:hypothetical protein